MLMPLHDKNHVSTILIYKEPWITLNDLPWPIGHHSSVARLLHLPFAYIQSGFY